ncbi:hypothetical protein NPIL_320611, partial [Nephila pilipes]
VTLPGVQSLPSTPKRGTSRTLSRCSKKNFFLQVGAGFNAKCPSKGNAPIN